jgi:Flp pilus assembly CpaF family ATPase
MAYPVLHLIERIVGPLGLRVDQASPWVDARLPDGSGPDPFSSRPFVMLIA